MRTRQTARKSCGGLAPRKSFQDLMLERLRRQRDRELQSTPERHPSSFPRPLNGMSLGSKDNMTINATVGQNEPTRFQVNSSNATSEMLANTSESQRNSVSSVASFINEPSASKTTVEKIHSTSISIKRTIARKSSQKNTFTKRTKNNQEKMCNKLIENCDKNVLFDKLLTELDAEKLLQGYKEKRKRNNWTNKDIQEEAYRILDDDLEIGNSNSVAKISSLQKLLREFSNFVGDNFVNVMLETFGDQLNATKVLKLLKPDDLNKALLQKFTAVQFFDLFSRSYTNDSNQILELVSADSIINHLRLRNDLDTSKLLNVLLEKFSQIKSEKMNEDLEYNVIINSDLEMVLMSAVVNLVKSKKYLKTSECLFNVMLQSGPKSLSDETKKNLKTFLMKKFSGCELNDLAHEVMSYHLAERIIELD